MQGLENKNNNKVLIIMVIVLSILVVFLGGFIIYKEFYKNDSALENKKSTTTKNVDKYAVLFEGDAYKLLKEAGFDTDDNIENEKYDVGEHTFTFKCTNEDGLEEGGKCASFEVLINDIEYGISAEPTSVSELIVLNDIVVFFGGQYLGSISVIDQDGKFILKDKEIVLSHYTDPVDLIQGESYPNYKDGKLYYSIKISETDDEGKCSMSNVYMDFKDNNKVTEIDQTVGYIGVF